jgi:hypothetical protein
MGKSEVNAPTHGETLQKSFGLSRRHPIAATFLQRLGENPESGLCLYPIAIAEIIDFQLPVL